MPFGGTMLSIGLANLSVVQQSGSSGYMSQVRVGYDMAMNPTGAEMTCRESYFRLPPLCQRFRNQDRPCI